MFHAAVMGFANLGCAFAILASRYKNLFFLKKRFTLVNFILFSREKHVRIEKAVKTIAITMEFA